MQADPQTCDEEEDNTPKTKQHLEPPMHPPRPFFKQPTLMKGFGRKYRPPLEFFDTFQVYKLDLKKQLQYTGTAETYISWP